MGHPNQHHQPGEYLLRHFPYRIFLMTRLLFASFSALLAEGEQIIIPRTLTSEVLAAIQSVRFIAQHIKDSDRDNEVSRLHNDFVGIEMSIHARTYDNSLPLDEAH